MVIIEWSQYFKFQISNSRFKDSKDSKGHTRGYRRPLNAVVTGAVSPLQGLFVLCLKLTQALLRCSLGCYIAPFQGWHKKDL
jgi:hypothetical protein